MSSIHINNEKRLVSSKRFHQLKQELNYLESVGSLTCEEKDNLLTHYEIKEKTSFIQVISVLGSILLGIGILSFIASNWIYLDKSFKLILIIGIFIGLNVAGYKIEIKFPKTSSSLFYVSCLTFGAGIFLINQMFNIGGDYLGLFLWWSVGIIPLAYILKDRRLLLFINILMICYMWSEDFILIFPFEIIIWIITMYFFMKIVGFSKLNTLSYIFLNISFLTYLFIFINEFINIDETIMMFIYFGIGWLFVYLPLNLSYLISKEEKHIYYVIGVLLHGTVGVCLTLDEFWNIDYVNIIFGIIYFVIVLILSKKGSLLNLLILCSLIFRFYLDISYDFLPKSLVFILGGILLLFMGYTFEKQRKKGCKIK